MGLNAFEYQSSHGIRIVKKCKTLKQSEKGKCFFHARPYYVNMCSKEKKKKKFHPLNV